MCAVGHVPLPLTRAFNIKAYTHGLVTHLRKKQLQNQFPRQLPRRPRYCWCYVLGAITMIWQNPYKCSVHADIEKKVNFVCYLRHRFLHTLDVVALWTWGFYDSFWIANRNANAVICPWFSRRFWRELRVASLCNRSGACMNGACRRSRSYRQSVNTRSEVGVTHVTLEYVLQCEEHRRE